MRTKSTANRDATLELIKEAAAEVFRRDGYAAARMGTIADEVGLHKTSLYHYIDSKESLLISLARDSVGTAIDDLEAISKSSVPPCERVQQAVGSHVLVATSRPGPLIAFVLYVQQITDEEVREELIGARRRYAALFTGVVEDALRFHGLGDTSATQASLALLGMCNWIPHWYSEEGDATADQIAASFGDLASRMVGCSTDGCPVETSS